MNCEIFREMMDDYHDGLLSEDVSSQMKKHLDGCDQCSAEYKKLAKLLEKVYNLPEEINPKRDLWPLIKEGIREKRKKSYQGWKMLSLAAVFIGIMAFSFVSLYMNVNRNANRESKVMRQFDKASKEYLKAREELIASLQSKKGVIKEETIATIENNLDIIDQAIGEIKVAISKEPDNERLVLMLSDAYHKETDLLLSTRELIANINNQEE